MNYELERIWKKADVAYFNVNYIKQSHNTPMETQEGEYV
jgi:hypothetical protein